jgi:hypothetical protein
MRIHNPGVSLTMLASTRVILGMVMHMQDFCLIFIFSLPDSYSLSSSYFMGLAHRKVLNRIGIQK